MCLRLATWPAILRWSSPSSEMSAIFCAVCHHPHHAAGLHMLCQTSTICSPLPWLSCTHRKVGILSWVTMQGFIYCPPPPPPLPQAAQLLPSILLVSRVSPPSCITGTGFLYVYIDVSNNAFWPPGLPARYMQTYPALPLLFAISA